MTWHEHAIATSPAGQQSTAQEGVLVICDDCRSAEEWFSRAAVDRGGVTGIQKLLYRRGWSLDNDTQRDRCPRCTSSPQAVA